MKEHEQESNQVRPSGMRIGSKWYDANQTAEIIEAAEAIIEAWEDSELDDRIKKMRTLLS